MSKDVAVQVSPANGFAGTVQIDATGLPQGVTAANLSISVAGGPATGNLQLTAASNASITNNTVTVQGTSGAIKHSVPLTVETASLATTRPFTTLGGGVLKGFYDSQRQLLFTSNFFLNELDVLSATDLSLKQRITLPQPVGIDQMPDGKTLVVGTMTQCLYLVDEDTFAAHRVPIPNLSNISTTTPLVPVAMANGKVLFIGQDVGAIFHSYFLEGWIYEWNPADNTFAAAPISAGPTGPSVTEHLARSSDHKFAIFDQGFGVLFLYSSDNDSFKSLQNNFYAGDVAGNFDGTQFAESINGTINFYDANLNLTASVPLSPRSNVNELALDNPIQYSPDGSRLYVQVTDQTLSPVAVIDAKQFKELGMIPTYYRNPSVPATLLAADNSLNVYEAAAGGVGILNCGNPSNSLSVYELLPLSSEPDSVPLNMATSVTFPASNLPPGTAVTVGGIAGGFQSNSSGQAVVTVPPSSVALPADFQFNLPDGTTYVFPQDFSYGVTAAALSANFAADQTATPLDLYGFGLVPQNQPPSVSFGGIQASSVNTTAYGVTGNSLERIHVTTPPSGPGTVDLVVNNTNGSSTLKSALTYLPTTIVPSAPGLSFLLFDYQRNLVYATRTNGSQLYVFDPSSMQWKPPLQPPAAQPGATYGYIALTADGSKLIAIDSTNAVVSVFSPDNPGSGQSISLRNANAPNSPPANILATLQANYVAPTSSGKAIINVVGWYPAELDLTNMTFAFRSDTGLGLGAALFRTSADGTHIAAAAAGFSSGGALVWDSTTDKFHGQSYEQFVNDIAISRDGNTLAIISIDQLAPDDISYLLDYQLHLLNTPAYPDLAPPETAAVPGIQFSPQGTLYLIPRQNSIDFIDVATGKLRARYATPEPILTPQNVVDVKGALAVDAAGQTIVTISASGITVVKFSAPIDGLTQPVWPFSTGQRDSIPKQTALQRTNMSSHR